MLDGDWSLSGKNGRLGLVAMVYVVATRGKLLKGTSREQAFLQKRPVAIKHFCERDQSRSQITTSNYKLQPDGHTQPSLQQMSFVCQSFGMDIEISNHGEQRQVI